MPSRLLLNGNIDDQSTRLHELEAENQKLRQQNLGLVAEVNRARSENARAIAALRSQLAPLYQALQAVFGEMESFDPVVDDIGTGTWEAIKQRLSPRLREAIDILLVQKRMRRTQLAAAMKMDYSNCTKNVIGVLIRQGLLIEDNRELRLKEL